MTVMLGALVLAGLVAGTWMIGGLSGLRTAKDRSGIVGVHGAGAPGTPDVSIIVPARNESATLPTLLRSLVALDPGPREIIVVDDSSGDDTALIADRLGATQVVSTSPPAGWLGKPWACHTGAERATGSHLLFLDADTWLSPGALGGIIDAHGGGGGGGLTSVEPYHVTERPYEELSVYCSVVSMLGSGAFAIGGPIGRAVAFGPCLFTSAADYRSAGGHEAVRGAVLEDVELARAYARAGLAVSVWAGRDAIRFRMYPGGLRQLVEGWSKNMASGAATASPIAVAAAVLVVAAHAAVGTATISGVVRWVAGDRGVPVTALVCWVVVVAHLRLMLGRIGSFRWWTAVAFPLPLLAFLMIFARSIVLIAFRREVTWRGRRIPLGSGDGP